MRHPTVVDAEALLAELTDAGVEFIVVGGAAALLHGAPITTQDLDIVHRRSPEKEGSLREAVWRNLKQGFETCKELLLADAQEAAKRLGMNLYTVQAAQAGVRERVGGDRRAA